MKIIHRTSHIAPSTTPPLDPHNLQTRQLLTYQSYLNMPTKEVTYLLAILSMSVGCSGFVSPRLQSAFVRKLRSKSLQMSSDIIDAEIVRDDESDGNGDDEANSPSKTLVDLSLDSAPEWMNIVVEFVEKTSGGNLQVIACRMPFTADVDGTTYSIGTPFEDTVAVLTDDEDGKPLVVDPDDDDNEWVFQLAATELYKNMGEDIRLRKTPRVLTVQGDLKAQTGKYMKESKDVKTEDLIKEEDEDDAYFDTFFKEQLGAGYEDELALDDDDEEAKKLLDLFNIPGLGTEEDDEEGIKKMLCDLGSEDDGESNDDAMINIAGAKDGTKALPLFPFTSPEGKSYAFVQLAQNPLLVGREDPGLKKTQRMLLDADEAAEILPRIEAQFEQELEEILGSED